MMVRFYDHNNICCSLFSIPRHCNYYQKKVCCEKNSFVLLFFGNNTDFWKMGWIFVVKSFFNEWIFLSKRKRVMLLSILIIFYIDDSSSCYYIHSFGVLMIISFINSLTSVPRRLEMDSQKLSASCMHMMLIE